MWTHHPSYKHLFWQVRWRINSLTVSFCPLHSVRQWARRLHAAAAETGWRGSGDTDRSPREIDSNRNSSSSTRQVNPDTTQQQQTLLNSESVLHLLKKRISIKVPCTWAVSLHRLISVCTGSAKQLVKLLFCHVVFTRLFIYQVKVGNRLWLHELISFFLSHIHLNDDSRGWE